MERLLEISTELVADVDSAFPDVAEATRPTQCEPAASIALGDLAVGDERYGFTSTSPKPAGPHPPNPIPPGTPPNQPDTDPKPATPPGR